MIYCDTSLLVSALTAEAMSATSRRWLVEGTGQERAISWWVNVELVSALAAKSRAGELTNRQREQALAFWTVLRLDMALVAITHRHFTSAEHLVAAGNGLRASDALHLAIVAEGGWEIATLDRGLAKAARAIGVSVPIIEA